MLELNDKTFAKSETKSPSPLKQDKKALLDSRQKKALLDRPKSNSPTECTSSEQTYKCPFCNFTSNTEVRIQMHVVSQHAPQAKAILCPLCQEGCKDIGVLKSHMVGVHNVIKDVQRLLLMLDISTIESSKFDFPESNSKSDDPPTPELETPEPDSKTSPESKEWTLIEEMGEDLSCSFCNKSFYNVDDLFAHQRKMGHMELKPTPSGLEYQCWKKGCLQSFETSSAVQLHFKETHSKKLLLSVSDHHVYNYRCRQCSLDFMTLEKLQLHSQYHMIRAAPKCVLCGRSFRSVIALQKHVETSHTDATNEQLEQYKVNLANNYVLSSGGVLDSQTTGLLKKESMRESMEMDDIMEMETDKKGSPTRDRDCDSSDLGNGNLESTGNNQNVLKDNKNCQNMVEDSYNDPNRKYKCHRCKVAFTRQSYLTSHNKTLLHRKGEKISYPMKRYLDSNRPFKCDICMESFTKIDILFLHYNSVSHLHKVKLNMKENNSTAAIPSTSNTSKTSVSGVNVFTTPASSAVSTTTTSTVFVDAETKPFKSNICNVAYSQDSTLKIIARSVLHQPRASELQELALMEPIDLSVPLIERSELHELALMEPIDLSVPLIERSEQLRTEQQGLVKSPTMINESSSLILQGSTSTSVPSSVQTPIVPDLTQVPVRTVTSAIPSITSVSPHLSPDVARSMAHVLGISVPQPPVLLPSRTPSQPLINCSTCNAIFMSYDSLLQHQHICCFFNPHQSNLERNIPVSSNALTQQPSGKEEQQKTPLLFPEATNPTPNQLSPELNPLANQLSIRPKCSFPRPRSLVYKHLIESFGFDVVMHFNENNQRRRKVEDKSSKENEPVEVCKDSKTDANTEADQNQIRDEEDKKDSIADLPEISPSVCDLCSKEFSSIWVLKTHREVVHKYIVPFELLMEFAEAYRKCYEKQNSEQLMFQSVCDENLNDLNPPTPSVSSEALLCPTPSSVSSSNNQQPPITPPASSLSSQIPDMSTSVTANQMAAQSQFNQLMMTIGHGMGTPMGMNFNSINLNMNFAAAAAMNLHPPLIPVLLPPPMNPMMASAFNHPMVPGGVDSNYFAAQQKMMQHRQHQIRAAVAVAARAKKRRARTRINDEQLKILRTYFDMNDSPTKEQLIEMSDKSGLPLEVIKRWFTNTLFKERQRNKDSPYNFNNPPSMFLNLEEYEKTGDAKVVPITRGDHLSKIDAVSTNQSEDGRSLADDTDSYQEDKDKHEDDYHSHIHKEKIVVSQPDLIIPSSSVTTAISMTHSSMPCMDKVVTSISERIKEDCRDVYALHSESSSPPPQPSINISAVPSISGPMLPNASSPPASDSPSGINSPSYCGSSSGGTGSGKRSNRTRFTDYQIKVLKDFFERNAYPKENDLEYLSKLLSLSPRVIMVWFQNARQKARKVFQPPVNVEEDIAGKFQRTPELNYQYWQVFQRYYEHIKHQKNSCFKDENHLAMQMKPASAAMMDKKSRDSSVSDTSSITNKTADKFSQNGTYRCNKCSLSFPRFDHWKEHQTMHFMNPNLFPNYSPNSSLGILQYEAQQPPTPPPKRKLSEEDVKDCDTDSTRGIVLKMTQPNERP